ncbi:VCBS repeat protein [Streptomyces sp. PanSC19]|nr:VCBS repeat protein [Streptomyces sp. PanSC19]
MVRGGKHLAYCFVASCLDVGGDRPGGGRRDAVRRVDGHGRSRGGGVGRRDRRHTDPGAVPGLGGNAARRGEDRLSLALRGRAPLDPLHRRRVEGRRDARGGVGGPRHRVGHRPARQARVAPLHRRGGAGVRHGDRRRAGRPQGGGHPRAGRRQLWFRRHDPPDERLRPPADLVARDRGGVLWLHRGTGSSSRVGYESRVRVGGGWNTYTRFSGGSDLTGDGRADLVAVDKAGDLYLYKGTGDTSAPFAPRRKTGYGWGIYNRITAVGNVGGGPAGDLVARDKDGVLWLYLGRGDGTFAPRTKIGGGWNAYADVVGIGDGNKDGRPDLYARTAQGAAYFYAGTGDWKAPFRARTSTGAGAGRSWAGEPYQQVS